MRAYGLGDKDFEIRLNSRKIMNFIINDYIKLPDDIGRKIARVIDKKEKLPDSEFKKAVTAAVGEKDEILLTLLESKNFDEFVSHLPKNPELEEILQEMHSIMESLERLGIRNVVFVQTLMRGFDYYTGTVFEIFDTNPKNRRALFGGGRYDNLLKIFGVDTLPAVGYAAGDVTIRDALEIRGLLPQYRHPARLAICIAEPAGIPYANDLAQSVRSGGISAVVDVTGRKLGDQIKAADKNGIPYIVCVGGEEVRSGTLKVKELSSGVETVVADDKLAAFLKE
jgi:histidyl-tRNA synthetase